MAFHWVWPMVGTRGRLTVGRREDGVFLSHCVPVSVQAPPFVLSHVCVCVCVCVCVHVLRFSISTVLIVASTSSVLRGCQRGWRGGAGEWLRIKRAGRWPRSILHLKFYWPMEAVISSSTLSLVPFCIRMAQ